MGYAIELGSIQMVILKSVTCIVSKLTSCVPNLPVIIKKICYLYWPHILVNSCSV